MPFLNTLLLLLALAVGVCMPLFVGHGLSAHGGPWIPLGLGCAGVSAALLWLHIRLLDRRERRPAPGP